MQICKDCGTLFEDDECPTYEEDYGFETGVGFKSCTQTFEECGCGGDLTEAKQCEYCMEWEDPENMIEDVCERCLEKESDFENALGFGEQQKENVEINGYLASEFTAEEIEEILFRELKQAKELGTKLKYKEFCLKDKQDFAIWLKK